MIYKLNPLKKKQKQRILVIFKLFWKVMAYNYSQLQGCY